METNERQLTVKDVLTDVRAILGVINIPGDYIESIGMPIAKAIYGIQICLDAMNQEKQEDTEPEVEVTAEPGGEPDA